MSCSGCDRELTARPNAVCQNVVHWRTWSEEIERKFQAKVDYARECFDDIEAALERWRARDGRQRSGDAPPAKKRSA